MATPSSNVATLFINVTGPNISLSPTFIPGFTYAMNYSPKDGVAKRVVFFKATVDSEKATPQQEEVSEILFLPFEEAESILTHESDKKLLLAAEKGI